VVRPSSYVWHLPQLLERDPNRPVVIAVRVSTDIQDRYGSLDQQINHELQEHLALGANVKDVVTAIESGKLIDGRAEFDRQVAVAREHEAVLSFADRSRLLRANEFHPQVNVAAIPTAAEFRALLWRAGGVPLATRIHPDLSPEKIKSLETRRGLVEAAANGRLPGRPSRFSDHEKRAILACHLSGDSFARIGERFGVRKSTIQSLIEREYFFQNEGGMYRR